MSRSEKRRVAEFVIAAEMLRAALAKTAHVLAECPRCNQGEGLDAARRVSRALDRYEPALVEMGVMAESWERVN